MLSPLLGMAALAVAAFVAVWLLSPSASVRLGHAAVAALSTLVAGMALWAAFVSATKAGLGPPGWLAHALLAVFAAAFALTAVRRIKTGVRVRYGYERLLLAVFGSTAFLAVLVTFGIALSVLAETVEFFSHVSPWEFLFGLEWSPQIAIRDDQVGASGKFGLVPLLSGTMLITLIALLFAVPVGLLAAIYLAEFASPALRAWLKPSLEFLAGVPTVVYGFFAIIALGPLLRNLGMSLGAEVSSESALAAGLMIGLMIMPMITSLAEDALTAVPDELRLGSFALGATGYETALQVAVPAALPGIAAGLLLALSRAIGETMIVVMAAGLSANFTANPLESVTTITVQIVTLLTGDQEFNDPKTLAAFALGMTLFLITLLINIAALHIVRRFQERYD